MSISRKYSLLPEIKLKKEKGFVLDCVAVGTFSSDTLSYNPKLGTGIPPYNSQKDKNARSYFQTDVVKKNLKKTGQVRN